MFVRSQLLLPLLLTASSSAPSHLLPPTCPVEIWAAGMFLTGYIVTLVPVVSHYWSSLSHKKANWMKPSFHQFLVQINLLLKTLLKPKQWWSCDVLQAALHLSNKDNMKITAALRSDGLFVQLTESRMRRGGRLQTGGWYTTAGKRTEPGWFMSRTADEWLRFRWRWVSQQDD